MDRTRKELFTGPSLALNQDGKARLCCLSAEIAKLRHRLADVDQLLEGVASVRSLAEGRGVKHRRLLAQPQLTAQQTMAPCELTRFERTFDHERNLLSVEWSRQNLIDGRALGRSSRGLTSLLVDDHQAHRVRVQQPKLTKAGARIVPLAALANQQVDPRLLSEGQGLLGGAYGENTVTVLDRKRLDDAPPLRGITGRDQNGTHVSHEET